MVKVVLVGTGVDSDTSSNSTGGSKGEDSVQKVNHKEYDRPCRSLEEVCQDTVDT